MNYNHSLRHLFNKVIIPNISNNKKTLKYQKNKTLPNQKKRPYSSFNTIEKAARKECYKNLKPRKFSTNSKRTNNQYNSLKKEEKNNLLNYNSDLEYYTNTTQTQTQTLTHKSKLSMNSFRSKYLIKNKKFKKHKNYLSSFFLNSNNNNEKIYLDNNINKSNNICIGSNINKTINNVVVDNNIDLLREYKYQTVNNFNNKYKLKFKAKAPKIHNKIRDIFSLLKLYKYEEEKKMDTIKSLVNEKPKKIKRKKKKIELFNQKEFDKNFSLIENDFDIKNKLKDDKKFVYIHTLNLLKNNNSNNINKY
jgi:hypothetical protein